MLLRMLKSKIHRAVVSDTDLHYEGSITIDATLMKEAGILPYEEVSIWNVTNGERFDTYAVPGRSGNGEIIVNGAGAHKAKKGDIIIIAAFTYIEEGAVSNHKPNILLVDEFNRMIKKYHDVDCRSKVI